jgi:hypothetical protein
VVGDLAGPAHPLGFDRGVREDGLRHGLGGPALLHDIELALHGHEVLVDVLGPAEAQGHEVTDERQATGRQGVPQLRAVAKVARWPELRARVAGRRHLIEHRGRLERQRVAHGLFEDAPRYGRRGNLDLAHRPVPPRRCL